MFRRVGAMAVAAAATLALASTTALAATKVVYAGGPPSTPALVKKLLGKGAKALVRDRPGIDAFSNQTVTIHAGDAVKWSGLASGFHTVDLPALGARELPLIVPGNTVTGVIDAAASPFWFNGHVPALGFNPQLFAPSGGLTYNGTKRIESGLPVLPHSSDTLKVTFTKPGVYRYFCDVHPGMIGYVVVRPKGKRVPSAKQDVAALTRQLTTDIRTADKASKAKQPPDHVSLGLSTQQGVELYGMFPASLAVKAGTVVTFSMSQHSREVHSATFGPVKYVMTLAKSIAGPAFDQQGVYPSSSPAAGPIQLSSASHGNGFANTGLLDRDPATPLPASGRIDFTTPGTYHFICLIHPFMTGTIVVK